MGLLPDGDLPRTQATNSSDATNPSRKKSVAIDPTLREAMQTMVFWLFVIGMTVRVAAYSTVSVHFVPIMVWKGLTQNTRHGFACRGDAVSLRPDGGIGGKAFYTAFCLPPGLNYDVADASSDPLRRTGVRIARRPGDVLGLGTADADCRRCPRRARPRPLCWASPCPAAPPRRPLPHALLEQQPGPTPADPRRFSACARQAHAANDHLLLWRRRHADLRIELILGNHDRRAGATDPILAFEEIISPYIQDGVECSFTTRSKCAAVRRWPGTSTRRCGPPTIDGSGAKLLLRRRTGVADPPGVRQLHRRRPHRSAPWPPIVHRRRRTRGGIEARTQDQRPRRTPRRAPGGRRVHRFFGGDQPAIDAGEDAPATEWESVLHFLELRREQQHGDLSVLRINSTGTFPASRRAKTFLPVKPRAGAWPVVRRRC